MPRREGHRRLLIPGRAVSATIPPSGFDGDPAVAVQPPVAADQLGAEALQPGGLPLVVPAGHHSSRRANTAGSPPSR